MQTGQIDMCGICGLLRPALNRDLKGAVTQMADALHHRGPDECGIWADRENGIALGHRRLSVQDLTAAGSQPMTSACGRYVMAFNGEIYNHLTLRSELHATGFTSAWRGESDTETLLASIAQLGIKRALKRAYGMFSLAVWDTERRQLHLARDRMGEKPLYLARIDQGWAFGSELKALLSAPDFNARLCCDAITSYLAYGYVPDTQCIFEGVEKVPPGYITTLSLTGDTYASEPFDTFNDLLNSGLASRKHNARDPVDFVEATLTHVVKEQMLSDVPLGSFLSGGVDSSLITALMQSHSAQPVRTFAIGFKEQRFNEAQYAAIVAKHLKTEHAEFILSENDALNVITNLPNIYDEPFADSSQIPTALLCREARKEVTVALTGDGGDEVFGGYNRHVIGPKLLSRLQRIPRSLRRFTGKAVLFCAPAVGRERGLLRQFMSKMHMPVTLLDTAVKLAPKLDQIDALSKLYEHFTQSAYSSELLLQETTTQLPLAKSFDVEGAEWMMAMDSVTYLRGDILVKVDRAAMAASLETRAPFLDPRVISAAWSLPLELKISDGKGKQVLRSLLDRHVPRDLIDRPKQGFAIPIDRWLRQDLYHWAEALISNDDLIGFVKLDSVFVHKLWTQHQQRAANNGTILWTILMLLDWIQHYRGHLTGLPITTMQRVDSV
ncbi:asparagine synthase (glutamine-hydrolyzing) [Pontixanthobacter sp.]|uniref:asparagine synthase (glutamine-hydrolyzing) n=1 Tax=Pontixanthobacter sp. TaxID=2792078 RepID=UPI003C7B0BB4